jgi:pimeloyl-ACP methyl ester carboxylesterase
MPVDDAARTCPTPVSCLSDLDCRTGGRDAGRGYVLMDVVEVAGLRIAYERVGRGSPLVLLHGYVGDGPATWRRQIEALAEHFTLIVWNAPGVDGSSDPDETIGMAGYADYLAGFLEALGITGAHVMGLSFGGALALEFAHRHPDVPITLILVSAYAGWRGSLPADVAEARLRQAIELADLAPDDFVDTLLPTMFSAGTPEATIDAFGLSMRQFHPVGFRAMARALAEDLSDVLATIDVPTLLVYGDHDVRAPLPVAEALHAALPHSELVVLPGAGHCCNSEAPEEFNRAIVEFLSINDARTSQQ